MRRIALLVLLLGLLGLAPAASAQAPAAAPADGAVVRIGGSVVVDHPVERVFVVAGDVTLTSTARVDGDVIVLFGSLHRAPGAQVSGSEYIVGDGPIDALPGPDGIAVVIVIVLVLLYRALVWAAVTAIAATLPRTATFERWAAGWEPRPGRALAVGVVAVAIAVPALGLLALTGFGIPLALIGLAALLAAAGAGLALFREGPVWPRRPRRAAYVAYLVVPPALEVGLLLTAAGGLGAGIRALSRRGRAPT